MRNDPDGEYSLLMFATMLIGTAAAWLAQIGALLFIPLWQPASWISPNHWMAWAAVAASGLVFCSWIFFMTWPLNGRERVGLTLIMLVASLPMVIAFYFQ